MLQSSESCPPVAPKRGLPLPRLVLRVGGLGNRLFASEQKDGIGEDPGPIKAAARQACLDVFGVIRDEILRVHRAETAAVFPLILNPVRFGWENVLASLVRFSSDPDIWQRSKRAGKAAATVSGEKPLIKVLVGVEQGGDAIVAEVVKGLPAAEVDVERVSVVVETEGAPPRATNGERFSVGVIPAKPRGREQAASPVRPQQRADARAAVAIARRRAFGFRAQSEALRHHSDLLIAVWDPDAEGRAGGTAESVALALRERVPVIAVRITGPRTAAIDLLRRLDDLTKVPGRSDWKSNVRTLIHDVLAFPGASAGPAPHQRGHFSGYHPRVVYHAFLEGDPFVVPWPGRFWRPLKTYLETSRPVGVAGLVAVGRFLCAFPFARWLSTESPVRKLPGHGQFERYYGAAKDRASELAEVFGDAHRGGIIASYVLATMAVLIALSGHLLHDAHAPVAVLAAVGGLEFVVLVLLSALWRTATVQDWHEAFTDTRILAEALRCMRYLGPLGVHTPLPKLPPHLADVPGSPDEAPLPYDPRALWSVWYFRALVRQAPIQIAEGEAGALECSREALLEAWIGAPGTRARGGSQSRFHAQAMAANARLFHGVERVTQCAFVVVIAAAFVHFGDLTWQARRLQEALEAPALHTAGHLESRPDRSAGREADAVARHALHSILFFVCAGIPITLATASGFLAQIDAVRLRQRSESMSKLLAERHSILSGVDVRNPTLVEARWGLAVEAAATAGLMVDETAGWSLIYRNSDIRAG